MGGLETRKLKVGFVNCHMSVEIITLENILKVFPLSPFLPLHVRTKVILPIQTFTRVFYMSRVMPSSQALL